MPKIKVEMVDLLNVEMEELLNVKIKQAARPLTAMEAGIAIGEGCGHEAQSSKRLDDERRKIDKEN